MTPSEPPGTRRRKRHDRRRTRRRDVLLVLGVALTVVAAWTYPKPGRHQAALTTEPDSATATTAVFERALSEIRAGSVPPADDPTAGAPSALRAIFEAPPEGPAVVGRVRIPAIEVDVEVREGVYEGVLERGPGHWPGTPLPTMPGNAVLSGHRVTFTKPFNRLDRLRPGDEVIATVGPEELVYRVEGTEIVPESRYVDAVLAPPAGPQERVLTLFACHPKFSRQQRIVVRARADDAPPPPQGEALRS